MEIKKKERNTHENFKSAESTLQKRMKNAVVTLLGRVRDKV